MLHDLATFAALDDYPKESHEYTPRGCVGNPTNERKLSAKAVHGVVELVAEGRDAD